MKSHVLYESMRVLQKRITRNKQSLNLKKKIIWFLENNITGQNCLIVQFIKGRHVQTLSGKPNFQKLQSEQTQEEQQWLHHCRHIHQRKHIPMSLWSTQSVSLRMLGNKVKEHLFHEQVFMNYLRISLSVSDIGFTSL